MAVKKKTGSIESFTYRKAIPQEMPSMVNAASRKRDQREVIDLDEEEAIASYA